MFSKHTSGTLGIFLAYYFGWNVNRISSNEKCKCSISIGQATNPTNICGLSTSNPVFCQNTGDNLVVVNPAPDVNQVIDVTGNQLITPTNECDDDNGHTCINDGAGNAFVLTHDTFADVQVTDFEQDITADNTCFFFQEM